MNLNIFLTLFILVFIAGYLTGFIIKIYACADAKDSRLKRNLKKGELEETGQKYESDPKQFHNSLASRFTDKGNTFTDLVCETEDVDSQKYVERKRKHQTKAYNYANIKENEG